MFTNPFHFNSRVSLNSSSLPSLLRFWLVPHTRFAHSLYVLLSLISSPSQPHPHPPRSRRSWVSKIPFWSSRAPAFLTASHCLGKTSPLLSLVRKALQWHRSDHLPSPLTGTTPPFTLAKLHSLLSLPQASLTSRHLVHAPPATWNTVNSGSPCTGWEQNYIFIFISFYLKLSISISYDGREQTRVVLASPVTFSQKKLDFLYHISTVADSPKYHSYTVWDYDYDLVISCVK